MEVGLELDVWSSSSLLTMMTLGGGVVVVVVEGALFVGIVVGVENSSIIVNEACFSIGDMGGGEGEGEGLMVTELLRLTRVFDASWWYDSKMVSTMEEWRKVS
jgi:hypothetical protein